MRRARPAGECAALLRMGVQSTETAARSMGRASTCKYKTGHSLSARHVHMPPGGAGESKVMIQSLQSLPHGLRIHALVSAPGGCKHQSQLHSVLCEGQSGLAIVDRP